jgi:ATP-dependent DNA helicase RecQ
VSPERLENEKFIEFVQRINISFIAVDEAHCISQWGHDFRKTYLEIPRFLEHIKKKIPILALTATATPQVKKDIVSKLEFKNHKIFVDSFERGNIYLKVKLSLLA